MASYPPPIRPTNTFNPDNFVPSSGFDFTTADSRYLKKTGDTAFGLTNNGDFSISGNQTNTGLVTANGGLTTGGASVLTSAGTTTLTGATTATGLLTANGGISSAGITATNISTTGAGGINLTGTGGITSTAQINANGGISTTNISATGTSGISSTGTGGITSTAQITANGGISTTNITASGTSGISSTGTGGITSTAQINANGGISTTNISATGTQSVTGLLSANGGLTLGGANNITLGSGVTAPTLNQLGYSYTPTITWSQTQSAIGSQSLPAGVYIATFQILLQGTFTANNAVSLGTIGYSNTMLFPVIQFTFGTNTGACNGSYIIKLTSTQTTQLNVMATNTNTMTSTLGTWIITRIA